MRDAVFFGLKIPGSRYKGSREGAAHKLNSAASFEIITRLLSAATLFREEGIKEEALSLITNH